MTGPHRLLVGALDGVVAGYAKVGRKHARWVDVRWYERPVPADEDGARGATT